MCELFAISSDHEIRANEYLRSFFSHCDDNPHGWGMAMFYGSNAVSLEKEPLRADESLYLKERLSQDINVSVMLAHIRRATIGHLGYSNTHPFVNRDNRGRCWTLAHNGTIFRSTLLRPYLFSQEGETDSERILCHIIDSVNNEPQLLHKSEADTVDTTSIDEPSEESSARMAEQDNAGLQKDLSLEQRCELVDRTVKALAPGNKLNILLYDGEILYVHSNMKNTLFYCELNGAKIFATVPFSISAEVKWKKIPFMTVCAYRDGRQIWQGSPHTYEYLENPEDMQYLYTVFSGL